MQTNFLLGELKITDPARLVLRRLPFDLICRHAINEHGQINEEERRANDDGMQTLGPIISRYKADPTDPHSVQVVIQTRATWDETLIDVATT
jgi:hypothetical protein